jgi:hypothetical protein
MANLPLFLRKFIVDFVETAIEAALAVVVVFPNTLDQAQQAAVIVGIAILGALVPALRRAVPDFLAWFRATLGVNQ